MIGFLVVNLSTFFCHFFYFLWKMNSYCHHFMLFWQKNKVKVIIWSKIEVTKMLFSKKNQAKNFKFSIVYTMMFSDAWKSYIYSNLMSFFKQFFMKILSKMSKFLLKISTCTYFFEKIWSYQDSPVYFESYFFLAKIMTLCMKRIIYKTSFCEQYVVFNFFVFFTVFCEKNVSFQTMKSEHKSDFL